MTTETAGEDAPASALGTTPAWLQLLEETIDAGPADGPWGLYYILSSMLKEYLLCDHDDAASIFARRFDDLYGSVYMPRFNGCNGQQKGWTGYLIAFYETLFTSAVAMQYDDPKQDKVIQLLAELRKLPAHPARIYVQPEFEWVDCEIWARDPLLPWELSSHEPYGALTIDSYSNLNDKEEAARVFDEAAADWVNFYSFQARCTGAGLDEGHRFRFDRTGYIISIGLTPGFPEYVEPKLDCHVMAAAQYILHAGEAIDAACVKQQLPPHRHHGWKGWADGKGPTVWKQWGTRLAEIADAFESGGELGFKLFDKNREAVRVMVVRARDKMVALEPELFAQPEPETAPEPGPS